jgi:phage baseplate assembly protein V
MARVNDQIMNIVHRGVLETADDSKGVQILGLSLLAQERKANVERFQNYGFSSVPTGEAEAIVIFPGGDRSAGVVVALDERASRMTGLAAGEVAIYTDEGDSIVLGRNQEITLTTKRLIIDAAENVTVNAEQTVTVNAKEDVTVNTPTRVLLRTPLLRVEGSIEATGTITPGVA